MSALSELLSSLLRSLASPPMASFSAAAALLSSSFEKREREDGSSYWALQADSPDWLRSAVMLAHENELPSDSRYELIRDAAVALSDGSFSDEDEAREALYELSTDLCSLSSYELLQWFSANLSRLSDCDEALDEMGSSVSSVSDALELGYRRAAENVLSVLISEIEENRSSLFNPDTDCRLLLSDSHGIYIPQLYCQSLSEEDAEDMRISWEDVLRCQSGPDEELYWEAWQSILDSAEITEPATLSEDASLWRLIQNGDLWQVRSDVEIPEEWF
jgi:hypothetical protein